MSEYPQDIMEAAQEKAFEWYSARIPTVASLRKMTGIIAAAILAERERAAKISDKYECNLLDYGGSVDAENFFQGGMLHAGQDIPTEIEND